MNNMTPAQFRSERKRLGFKLERVADLADLSLDIICDFEEGRPVNVSLVDTIRATMESLGARFDQEDI